MAREFAISAGHYLATEAGHSVLAAGGNAVDAGVAAGLALGVVQSDLVNVAGVAPIMLWHAASARVVNIDGLGVWPAAARIETFMQEHAGAIPEGLLRTVVPGAPSSWLMALERFGSLSFAEVAEAAIRLAEQGFAVDRCMAEFITAHAEGFGRWPENRAIYMPAGRPPRPGELMLQQDLAGSLRYMADEERSHAGTSREAGIRAAHDAFYKGDIARSIVAYHQANGGWMRMGDMAGFRARIEPSVPVRFAGLDVHCCGPWSQGPALAELLGLMEGLPLSRFGHNSADYVHHLVESVKLAFADRERHVGDADFVEVPLRELLDPSYLALRRGLIDARAAWPEMPPPGDPRRGIARMDAVPAPGGESPRLDPHDTVGAGSLSARDTSYVCVVDREGNAFSATPSDVACESPVIPGTGLCPSSRGSQGRADRDHPASVAPGKRPRLTPNPALALEAGRPRLVFGTPGGDVQAQAMAQLLANWRIFGMGVQQAIEAPRFASYSFPSSFAPNSYEPGLMAAEARLGEEVCRALEERGHRLERWPDFTRRAGALCAIEIDAQAGLLHAGADPRRSALAIGR
jgi:gamma-glutamyltranspeptidase/glutathione hydrolase